MYTEILSEDLIECRTEDATVVAQGVNYSSGDISNLKGSTLKSTQTRSNTYTKTSWYIVIT